MHGHLNVKCTFFSNKYARGENVFSTVLFTVPVFLVLSFQAPSELPKTKNSEVAINEPPRGSVNGPVVHSWNRECCFSFPELYKLFRLLFKC